MGRGASCAYRARAGCRAAAPPVGAGPDSQPPGAFLWCPEGRACVKSLQSCPTLCNPMGCSLPGSSVHVILRARILGCRALLQGMDLPNPGIESTSLMSPALAGRLFTTSATWEAQQGRDANSRLKTGLAGSALIFNYCTHTKWSSVALPPLRGVFDFTSHDFLNI